MDAIHIHYPHCPSLSKAAASRLGFGFSALRPSQKPLQAISLARLGPAYFGSSLAQLMAWGRAKHTTTPRAPSLLMFQTSALWEPLPFDMPHICSPGAWVGGRDQLGHVQFYWVQQCTCSFHSHSYTDYHIPYFPFLPYVKTCPLSLVWMWLLGDSCQFTFLGANITQLAVASI